MPCPKGFKHQQVYPRPNRKKRLAEVPPTCEPEAEEEKHAPQVVIGRPQFSCTDEDWLRSVGIRL